MNKSRRFYTIAKVVAPLIFAFFFLAMASPNKANAQEDERLLFGGRIQQVDICTCPIHAFLWLQIGPPRPLNIVVTWTSLQYLWFSYLQNSWALGDAGPVIEACLDLVPKKGGYYCSPASYGFPVIHIGTSLPSKGE